MLRRLRTVRFYILIIALCFHSLGMQAEKGKEPSLINPQEQKAGKKILFFGDSLTAGFGLDSPDQAFPYLVWKELSKSNPGLAFTNAGVSGDTTSGGLARLDWVLSSSYDIFVLELGANDSMRGVSPKVTEENLKSIIRRTRAKYPKIKILLLGMRTFPNLGKAYSDEFRAIYPRIAREEKVDLLPFLLTGVAAEKNLNQKDGIHPTSAGHKIVAKTVLPYIRKLVN
ncbi:GDSL-like protein [Leptospira inadai serovar Lyme str. 10]|uniref:GDSL-like protein n=2 Tax=Leptospira inadai serovar Lyme TaxID=293084 RepID=V6HAT4_9LEPT|nr:arylesterase [Leptospira inadai]EQA36347.1 GDSL-like protein [Leptospira inadai serovar Lyme str. 10]PNV75711.1 arylesterase [Leptospira inadai serovar Lyme]